MAAWIIRTLSVVYMMAVSVTLQTAPASAEPAPADKTLSPYFHVIGDDPSLDQLPLKSTAASVNIAGVIADVTVVQTYKNEGKKTIEAVYVFPASTRAAVYGMKMVIDERTIEAKIKERQAARREYEDARQAGKSASLLEQQRPNVFQMNVANVLPGDEIRVTLKYTELLVPTDGVYEFVYPTVVGPRYSEMPDDGAPSSEKWVKNPYLHEGESAPYTFDFKAAVSAGMPIDQIMCDTHKTNIQFDGPALATIQLDPSEKDGGNRDLILKYRLSGGKIDTGLLLYKGETENFFLLMMQPPKRVKAEQIPPREYIFIVDVSGSMRGFPLDTSKTLLKDLISGLRSTDTFNVLLFAGGSSLLSEKSLPASPDNIQKAIGFIDNERGGGGTRLLPAMKKALKLTPEEGVSRIFVIATDGYVRVEREAFDLIRFRLGDANFFPFGIGSSVNRYLLEGMARVGMGEPFVVTKPADAPRMAKKFRTYIQTPVLTDAEVSFSGFDAYDVEPPTFPDVMAERPVILFGKWRGKAGGSIQLKGFSGSRPYSEKIAVSRFSPESANSGLRYLWARHRIALLADYNQVDRDKKRVEEITKLGLDYNLLTAYTSFVAVDSLVRNKDEKSTTVKQPLPMPQGVPNYAVGAPPMGIGDPTVGMAPIIGSSGARRYMMSASPPPRSGLSVDKKAAQKSDGNFAAEAESSAPSPSTPFSAGRSSTPGRNIAVKLKGVSHAYLHSEIEKYLGTIKKCLRKWLDSRTLTSHKENVIMTLTLNGDGTVREIRWQSPGRLKGKDLDQCLKKAAEQWKFTPPDEGKPVIALFALEIEVGK